MIKKYVRILLYYSLGVVFYFLDRVVPKSPKCWCFSTWRNYPHTMDNLRAVFEIIKEDPEFTKIILLQGQGRPEWEVEGVNVKFVEEISLQGVFYLALSKVFLLGTSLGGFTSYHALVGEGHEIIQLWHGIPLKRIGKLFPPEKFWDNETAKYSATICSSPSDRRLMQKVFSPLALDRVWQTGLPRNNFILADDCQLPNDYYSELQKIRAKVKDRFLVLYAPTWRDSPENIYQFSKSELNQLSQVLTDGNAVMAIRGHANVRSQVDGEIGMDIENIFYVNDIPDVNLLLKEAGALITDYSSIYIDFLITDRPILYFTYDLNQYVNERGFLYELDEAFVCDPSMNFEQLLGDLKYVFLEGVIDSERYKNVKTLFHQHESSSAERVTENIKSLL